jgi:uncharacterized protein YdaU (DUF1376 family)
MSKRERPDQWLPLFVGDYLRDTMHLTVEQHGAYLLLLMHYWVRRGPLPDDDGQLAAIAKIDPKTWKKSVRAVVGNFFHIRDGKWTQKRMQSEIARADGISEDRSNAGKAGNEARWGGDRKQDRKTDSKPVAKDIAKPVANPSQNDPPLPLPLTSSSSAAVPCDPRARLLALCEILGVSPATDASTITRWPEELAKLLQEFDWDKHILPAAERARSKGVKPTSLNYLRGKATELRTQDQLERAASAPNAPVDLDTWRARMRIFRGEAYGSSNGNWSPAWGPKPGEPGCLVPAELLSKKDNGA